MGAGKIDLDEAVGFVVFQAHQAMRQAMFRVFRDEGVEVTPEQWVVMVRLWARDGRSQTELGRDTLRDKPTLSRMLDTMEERGWLQRVASPDDLREKEVRLTPRGRALEQKLVPLARTLVKRIVAGIDAGTLETTFAALRRMTANVRTATP